MGRIHRFCAACAPLLALTSFTALRDVRADTPAGDRPASTLRVARPGSGPRVAIDEARSKLRLEVDATCQPIASDEGTAGAVGMKCLVLERPHGGVPETVVLLAEAYSVEIVVRDEPGSGEERAQRVGRELCGPSKPGDAPLVSFAERRFVRMPSLDGRALCFVTSDERPETATVLFRALDNALLHSLHPELEVDLAEEADAVMQTLRAPGAPSPKVTPPTPLRAAPSIGKLYVFILVVIGIAGLFVLGLFVAHRRKPRAKRPPTDRQLAGLKCETCKQKIVVERTAMHCPECKLPVHKDCMSRHASAEHGPPAPMYR